MAKLQASARSCGYFSPLRICYLLFAPSNPQPVTYCLSSLLRGLEQFNQVPGWIGNPGLGAPGPGDDIIPSEFDAGSAQPRYFRFQIRDSQFNPIPTARYHFGAICQRSSARAFSHRSTASADCRESQQRKLDWNLTRP
jgi:hypothetical protein